MASFSAMLVRNIMPVCCCSWLIASSAINSSGPTQSLLVGSLGWAWVGSPGIGDAEGGGGGAAVVFLQPNANAIASATIKPEIPIAPNQTPKRCILQTGSGGGRFQERWTAAP